jgi:transcriptional adapter 2-alpha
VPLFHRDWTISEELKLFAGIERHGVGNWKVISEFMGSSCNKTIKQLEEHYNELYMGVHGYCLPAKVLVNDKFVDTEETFFKVENKDNQDEEEDYTVLDSCRMNVVKGYQRGEVVRRDIGKEGTSHKNSNNNNKDKPALIGSDLPGFIPMRKDFDVEYENDEENILADMEFSV